MKTMFFVMFFGFALQAESATLVVEPISTFKYQDNYQKENPYGVFVWNFNVTALDGDIFIRSGLLLNNETVFGGSRNLVSSTSVEGLIYNSFGDFSLTFYPRGYYGHYEVFENGSGWAGSVFRVLEGETLEASLMVRVQSSRDSFVRMSLEQIEYSESFDWADTKLVQVGFQTNTLFIQGTGIPEPSSLTILFSGVLMGLRRRK